MKRFIRTEHQINAPADQVWSKIKQGDGVENWLPIIKNSRLEAGNRRFCEMHQGGNLEETILVSEGNKTFMYAIDKQEAFPVQNMVGIMRVATLENGGTQLNWDIEFDVEQEAVFQEVQQQIRQVYADSAEKLGEIA